MSAYVLIKPTVGICPCRYLKTFVAVLVYTIWKAEVEKGFSFLGT